MPTGSLSPNGEGAGATGAPVLVLFADGCGTEPVISIDGAAKAAASGASSFMLSCRTGRGSTTAPDLAFGGGLGAAAGAALGGALGSGSGCGGDVAAGGAA